MSKNTAKNIEAHSFTGRNSRLLTAAFLIAAAFVVLLLSYARVIGDARSAAFHTKIIDAALAQPIWGSSLGNNLLLFGLTQFSLHLTFVIVCWLLAKVTKKAWTTRKESMATLTTAWLCWLGGWLLAANATLFPSSSLGAPYAEAVRKSLAGITVFHGYTAAVVASLVLLTVRALWLTRNTVLVGRVAIRVAGCLTALTLLTVMFMDGNPASAISHTSTKPHVILIGIDSLRVDATTKGPASNTPAIDSFLSDGTRFSDVTTPLARTFPAWVSIITGRHPHTTNAVMNLLPREMIHTGETLPELFSRDGYHTVYAIDEVRFSNLDLSYGFDQMIAPPIGATDFFLGFFADTPLSNMVVNSRLGKYLFPYTHANRAAAVTYDPDTFVSRLDSELVFDRPTFLAVHFTLVHWPYTWAGELRLPDEFGETAREAYEAAVARVDRQFQDLMSLLRDRGVLENALVVLLSDHGESLGQIHPKPRPPELRHLPEYEEERLVGHGTSVFAPSQYRVLLAMRGYGAMRKLEHAPPTIDVPASLEDVTPTLSDLLGLPQNEATDGISLAAALRGARIDTPTSSTRIRFTETEFNPQGVVPGQIAAGSALISAASFYEVDPVSDRVKVRREKLPELLNGRQYAALLGEDILAAIPSTDSNGATRFRVVHHREHAIPTVIDNPATHSDNVVRELWFALSDRYPHLRTNDPN